VASTGTGAYAYSSSSVTEGTLLYPVKQNLENMEEKIQLTPEAKARFYLKKIERREAEVAQMNKKQKLTDKITKVQDKIEQAEDNLANVGKILEEKRSGDSRLREEIKQRLEKRIENRKDTMKRRINSLEERKTSINNKLNQLRTESD
jgi:chromosome segregation ATPase